MKETIHEVEDLIYLQLDDQLLRKELANDVRSDCETIITGVAKIILIKKDLL